MAGHDCFDYYRQVYPDGHKSNHTWAARLARIVAAAPNQTAFIQGERRLTWKEFDQRTNRLANALLDFKIKKGERVTIMGFNSIEWMESYFALSKIGAVPVNLNPRFVPTELKHVLDDSDSVALIVEADYFPAIEQIRAQLPLLREIIVMRGEASGGTHSYEELIASHPATPPRLPQPVTNADFAFLFYTGGTTGYPKGTVWDGYNRVHGLDALFLTAMKPLFERLSDLPSEAYVALGSTFPLPLPERFFKSRFYKRLIARSKENDRADRLTLRVIGSKPFLRLAAGKMKILTVAPLFHGTAYETNFAVIATNAGTSIYLTQNHPFNPAEAWETIERNRANLMVIVGDAFALPLVEELERKNYDISSLATIISSGVRWSPGVKKRFLRKNPGLILLDELGSTETSVAVTQVSASTDADISLLKVKIVPRGINCTRVINPVTMKDVGPGEKGELVFGGFNALGYWKDPQRTARCFRDFEGRRWFHVGDEGIVDAEGYFHFIGRGSSIINTGGEKVYAEEVEEILLQYPGIEDIGVTGIPDERWGEAVTALIKPGADADLLPEEILAFCRERMAGYKKPKHLFFVSQLPRSVTGKMQRQELKALALKLYEEKAKK